MIFPKVRLVTPHGGFWGLLVRVSPTSVLAFVVGLSCLYLPWVVYSSAGDVGFTGEFTRVLDVHLTDSFLDTYGDFTFPSMICLMVIGLTMVLFTSLAVVPLAAGLLLFLYSVGDMVGTLYSGPGSVNYVSYGLAPYLAVLVCGLGVLSAIPRISPSIVLMRKSERDR